VRALFASIALLTLAACGGNDALRSARTSLEASETVVTDLDERVAHGPSSFGDDTAAAVHDAAHDAGWQTLVRAVADARARVDEGDSSLDAWERDDSGDLAWRTVAPCLAASLQRVVDALRVVHAHDDTALEDALEHVRAEAVDACAEREPSP